MFCFSERSPKRRCHIISLSLVSFVIMFLRNFTLMWKEVDKIQDRFRKTILRVPGFPAYGAAELEVEGDRRRGKVNELLANNYTDGKRRFSKRVLDQEIERRS
jgi:hypothetical protein